MKERHVNYTELGLHTADSFGHPRQTKNLTDILNEPPLARRTTNELLATLVYQQAAVIKLLRDELKEIRLDVSAIRRDIKHAQANKEAAREKAAKAEEKAAKARERAALAEAEAAKNSEPSLLIQAGDSDNWEQLQDRIRRKF